LTPSEFEIIMVRFALYHYKWPLNQYDSEKEKELKMLSAKYNDEGKLVALRVMS
jgi:hypothetical protein